MAIFDEIFDTSDFEFDASREVDALLSDGRREALEDALSRVLSLNECWDVFRQFVTETIVDDHVFRQVVISVRTAIARTITETEYEKLINIASTKLMARRPNEVLREAAEQLLGDPESHAEITRAAVKLMQEKVREEVQNEMREQIKADPVFIEEVKRELKRQIMGI